MNKVRETIVDVAAPVDQNVIWVDVSGENAIQKVFLNGDWQNLSGGSVPTNVMTKISNPHSGKILLTDETGQAVESNKDVSSFLATPAISGNEGEILAADENGNPVWTSLTPSGEAAEDHMSDTSTKAVQNRVIKEYVDGNYARKDGYYSQMTVGSAENLVGQTVDSEAYLIRPTGGESNEVANSVASVLGMEGHTEKFNQLVQKGAGSAQGGTKTFDSITGVTTITPTNYSSNAVGVYGVVSNDISPINDVYYCSIEIYTEKDVHINFGFTPFINKSISSGKWTKISGLITKSAAGSFVIYATVSADSWTNEKYFFRNVKCINLTSIGIDNFTTTDQVEAWLAKNVGLKPYYGYNAGSLLSAQTLGIKTYGQNLLNPTTRQAKLIPYEWEENSNVYTIKNVPSGATATFTPDATGVAETVDISGGSLDITSYGIGILELSAATADTYVCMKWDEDKDDDVVPYEEHTQNFDVRKVYGKVNGAGEYVQCYPNGLRGAGTAKDTLTASEAVVRIGSVVDLGDASWTQQMEHVFYVSINDILKTNDVPIILNTGKYSRQYSVYSVWDSEHNYYGTRNNYTYLYFQDLNCSTVEQIESAMSGVKLNYELETPITYTDLIYRDGGIDRPLTDVLFNIEVNNWSIEEQLLTPYVDGSPTAVPAKISTQYGMDAVEEIDTIKHTYVSAYSEQNFSDSQKAQARHNIGAGTVNPTDNCPQLTAGTAKNLIDTHGVGSEQEFVFRETGGGTAISGNGNVTIQKFKGKTLKWQQMIQNGDFSNGTTGWAGRNSGGLSVTDGKLKITSVDETGNNSAYTSCNIVSGHKYFFKVSGISQSTSFIVNPQFVVISNWATHQSIISNIFSDTTKTVITANANYTGCIIYNAGGHQGEYTEIDSVELIDLTDLFGAGSEPSTPEEFEALYPLDYYAYTATPVLINNEVKQIETTGRNQWDEQWELGSIDGTTGENIPASDAIRSVGYIKIINGASYYFLNKGYNNNYTASRMRCYDSNKKYLGIFDNYYWNSVITFPKEVGYIRFGCLPSYGTTYNHDICINISDASFNGTYEAYHKNTIDINLDNFQVKDGENNVITVNGLKSAGSVYDEIDPVRKKYVKRIGSVDLGTLDWSTDVGTFGANVFYTVIDNLGQKYSNLICSKYVTNGNIGVASMPDKSIGANSGASTTLFIKDTAYSNPSGFKTAVQGVPLYYKLATPEEYDLVTTIPDVYATPAGGTEGIVPQGVNASGVPKTAPFRGTNLYSKDYVQTINDMPVDYDTTASIDALATALATTLGTALNGTLTITRGSYDETNKKYGWTVNFTANT